MSAACDCSKLVHDQDASFCYVCGKKRTLTCKCGYITFRPDAAYCAKCGKKYQQLLEEKKEDCLKPFMLFAIDNEDLQQKAFDYVFEAKYIPKKRSKQALQILIEYNWDKRQIVDMAELLCESETFIYDFKREYFQNAMTAEFEVNFLTLFFVSTVHYYDMHA